jgi:hypothetical protein
MPGPAEHPTTPFKDMDGRGKPGQRRLRSLELRLALGIFLREFNLGDRDKDLGARL